MGPGKAWGRPHFYWARPSSIEQEDQRHKGHACLRLIPFVSLYYFYSIWVLGCCYTTAQQFTDADCIPAVLMRQGVIPCAPYSPELLISVRTMEVFHNTHLQCPRLSLQAFLRILCDLNSIAYEPYMYQQFTICYDLYVAILKRVEHHINQVLCLDAADYRLWNACVAYTITLRDEPGTPIHPHYCMDGTNSLKRVQRQDDENQESSQERMDNHDGHEDYFLSWDEVNAWSKEAIGNTIVTDPKDTEGNPCADWWENMKNDMNSSMWGVFDETGVFVSLCRHSFLLLATDMVRSREL